MQDSDPTRTIHRTRRWKNGMSLPYWYNQTPKDSPKESAKQYYMTKGTYFRNIQPRGQSSPTSNPLGRFTSFEPKPWSDQGYLLNSMVDRQIVFTLLALRYGSHEAAWYDQQKVYLYIMQSNGKETTHIYIEPFEQIHLDSTRTAMEQGPSTEFDDGQTACLYTTSTKVWIPLDMTRSRRLTSMSYSP